MNYKLSLNNTIVGSIEILDGEYPSWEGVFTPNEHFNDFKKVYEEYYSNDPVMEERAESKLDQLKYSLIDEHYLWQDIPYMFIHVHEDFHCYWRHSIDKKYVKFYRINEYPYGCFSNFSKHPVVVEGKTWPTSEHFFQAKKFVGMEYEEEIRNAESAKLAAKLGNSHMHKIREDWEEVKEEIMHKALYAKFTQNKNCLQLLLQTQDAILVEHTRNDSYWADGGKGKGKNRLGILLMQLRKELMKDLNMWTES